MFLSACAAPLLGAQRDESALFADAEAYEHFMGRWSRRMAPLLVDFAGVPESGRILDAGSGTGALAFTIAERRTRVEVLGIDPSREYVAYATRRNSFGDRMRFAEGDAQDLHFAPASFAAAISLFVFNFIPDPAKGLAELRRVTVRGGTIAAAVWDYSGRMEMLRAFWEAAASAGPAAARLNESRMPLSHTGELARLWRQGGLDRVRERPLEIRMAFANFADYWDAFLTGQGPAGAYVRTLDDAHRQALRDALKLRLRVTAESLPLALPARAWAVRGINR